jgi:glycosyltransferase involved in cell wall biosynthesis
MPLAILSRKLRSARYRIERAFAQWKETAASDRKRRKFEAWLAELRSHPPDVLVGSNFAEYGGVRAHIHAIQKYSSLRVQLAPSDELLVSLEPHDLKTTFKEAFLNFEPAGIRTIHSHVFPWFIEWCGRHRRPGLLWVHTYHLPYFPEHSRGSLLPWQEDINDALVSNARHADVRISVARWEQAWLRGNHGIDTIYLPNGVDVALCERADPQRFVEHVGKSDFILYVGRNDPVKNPAEFVRLAHRMPRQQFVMIGRGLTAEILFAAWQVTAPDNLLVYGDASHSEVQDALAACGALVVTSKREGLPTVVLEAMAHSKPVVVPDEAGCAEAIGGGDCGLIYTPDDINDLAAKTIAALSDSGVGARGRERVLAEYDWRVVARKLDALYMARQ